MLKKRNPPIKKNMGTSKWVIASIFLVVFIVMTTVVVALSDAGKRKADNLYNAIKAAAVNLSGDDLNIYYDIVKMGLQESIDSLENVSERIGGSNGTGDTGSGTTGTGTGTGTGTTGTGTTGNGTSASTVCGENNMCGVGGGVRITVLDADTNQPVSGVNVNIGITKDSSTHDYDILRTDSNGKTFTYYYPLWASNLNNFVNISGRVNTTEHEYTAHRENIAEGIFTIQRVSGCSDLQANGCRYILPKESIVTEVTLYISGYNGYTHASPIEYGGGVNITVLDAETNQPVPGIRVGVGIIRDSSTNDHDILLTDSNGKTHTYYYPLWASNKNLFMNIGDRVATTAGTYAVLRVSGCSDLQANQCRYILPSGSSSLREVTLYISGYSSVVTTGGTCTSFTYSDYGACQSNNTQVRSILTKTPSGCTGGTPEALSKSCTVGGGTCTSFTYSEYGACQSNNTQVRSILTSTPSGCTGGTPETLSKSCTYVAPTCSGTLPTDLGVIIRANYPITVGGPSDLNTRWIYHKDLDSGRYQGCTWSCDASKYKVKDDHSGCRALQAGEGMTLRVLDETTNQPVSGVNVKVYGSLLMAGGIDYGTFTTSSNGNTPEFGWPEDTYGKQMILIVDKSGYVVKRGDICSVNPATPNNCWLPLYYEGTDHMITIYVSSAGVPTGNETVSMGNSLSTLSIRSCVNQKTYVVIDGLNKDTPTKGCSKPSENLNGCTSASEFRDFTEQEWGTSKNRVISTVEANQYPVGLYSFSIMINGTIKNLGGGRLMDCP